jgi:hypothetical protein
MLVKELIEKLKAMPQDAIAVITVDDEGNGYREIYFGPSVGLFDNEDNHFYCEEGIKELEDEGYDLSDYKNAVCVN